jgi:general secretion pathway protein L
MIIQIIQLSGHDVTCAGFRRTGKELVPVFGIRRSFQGYAELTGILKENLLPASVEVRTVLALPPALVALRELSLPMNDRTKLRAILPMELMGEIADESAELVCDALTLSNGMLLSGWASVPEVAELVQLLTIAGIEPEVVTCAGLTWHHLPPQKEQQEPIALVDDQALMVCLQGQPVLARLMSTTTDAVTRTLAALELSKGITVQRIYRLEGEALPGEEKLQLPDLLSGATASGDLPAEALLSPLAIALAYCSGEIFNLRNGPLAWTGKRSHLLKQFRIPLVLAMLILLLLPAEAGLRWFLLSRDIRSINTSVATIYKGIFPTRKKAVDETAEVRAEIRHLTNGTARSELLPFLHLLAQAKDEQIFGFSEVEYDGERFRLKGNAKNNEAVTALGNRLSATGWAVEQPELTARPDTTTLFVLKGRQGGRQP